MGCKMEQIFELSSLLVMPFWALMIFLPGWRWTQRTVAQPWIILPATLLYSALFIPQATALIPALLSPTLDNVQMLLGSPAGATIGWTHFLAFDLFVGQWAYLDARGRGLTAWLVSPLLVLILMAGPLGFLAYWTVSRLAGPAHR